MTTLVNLHISTLINKPTALHSLLLDNHPQHVPKRLHLYIKVQFFVYFYLSQQLYLLRYQPPPFPVSYHHPALLEVKATLSLPAASAGIESSSARYYPLQHRPPLIYSFVLRATVINVNLAASSWQWRTPHTSLRHFTPLVKRR